MKQLTTERIKSVGVLAASLVTTTNAALALADINPLPFTDSQAGTAVSAVLAFAVTLWTWWRHNVITPQAAIGHDVTVQEKAAAKQITTADHSETAVAAQRNAEASTTPATEGLTDGELKVLTAAWLADLHKEDQ